MVNVRTLGVAAGLLLSAGCGIRGAGSSSTVPPTSWWQAQSKGTQVYPIDFFGALVSAETDQFQMSSNEMRSGGPNSNFRVGPATLVLDDGTTIEVPPDTPGGNLCAQLGGRGDANQTCFVAGAFEPNRTRAAWFSTTLSWSPGDLDAIGFRDRAAQFYLDDHSRFELPIATDAQLDGCYDGNLTLTSVVVPNAAVFHATIDADDEVAVIECGYNA